MQHPAEVSLKVGPLPPGNNMKNFGRALEGKKRCWDMKFLWGNKEQWKVGGIKPRIPE